MKESAAVSPASKNPGAKPDHRCQESFFLRPLCILLLLSVTGKPVDPIVDPQAKEHGCEDHRKEVQMADKERGKAEG